jgi:hypothetical protein
VQLPCLRWRLLRPPVPLDELPLLIRHSQLSPVLTPVASHLLLPNQISSLCQPRTCCFFAPLLMPAALLHLRSLSNCLSLQSNPSLPSPDADNPLVSHPAVICTPHLGASTKEAQEEVAYEIAEAVISALNVCEGQCQLCVPPCAFAS